MHQNENTELRARIADLREFVAKTNREMSIIVPVVALIYLAAAIIGSTTIGWALFVAAVACSFYLVICQVVICQQNALAEIFERGVALPGTSTRENQQDSSSVE